MASMSREVTELLKKALELPVTDRAELAGSIIESLDQAEDKSVKDAWDAEILRRMEDLDSGRVKPDSLDEFRRRLASAIE
jgi:putative addiction module component (TIGR02574 family)